MAGLGVFCCFALCLGYARMGVIHRSQSVVVRSRLEKGLSRSAFEEETPLDKHRRYEEAPHERYSSELSLEATEEP